MPKRKPSPRVKRDQIDPARLAIFEALIASVAEEMGAALRHTALSPNIKERRDYSCAVFNPQGDLLAQAAHIPVHLGAMPESVQAVAGLAPWAPGDIAILNDPFLGGTHLPDVTMVSPVFAGKSARLIGFVASRAHQADIGGMAPGSLPVAAELSPGRAHHSAGATLSRRGAGAGNAGADPCAMSVLPRNGAVISMHR